MSRVLISGAGGFIGDPLAAALRSRGDEVVVLTRGPAGPAAVHWDPLAGEIDRAALHDVDAVVHLAGEPIAGLWTKKKRRAILQSRRAGTDLLTRTLAELDRPPAALISASATGIYGDRGDQLLGEDSGRGEGFLAEVVAAWEAAADPARLAGLRVVNLRLGLVIAERGGVMGPVRPLFRAGLGGRLGDGAQWWSWVTRDDVLKAFEFALDNDALEGPYNVTAPNPVTNSEFTRRLAAALHRPAVLPVPAVFLRALAGQMADELLLASQRADSGRLAAAGFEFGDVELDAALARVFS